MRTDRAGITRDEHGRPAALRDDLLRCGRRIGWSAHTTIAFTEGLTRRPWKRCSQAQLAAALDELHAVEAHRPASAGPRARAQDSPRRHREEHLHAPRP